MYGQPLSISHFVIKVPTLQVGTWCHPLIWCTWSHRSRSRIFQLMDVAFQLPWFGEAQRLLGTDKCEYTPCR